MNVEVTKVHKAQLLEVANPNYATLLDKHSHLKGVKMEDKDSRAQIPIHLVLGASEYATIKTATPPRVGKPGEPVAEKTLLGWTLMLPGREDVGSPILLTQSTSSDYEQLCALDVLGLSDVHVDDQRKVYEEFKEQLERNPAGWYETKLPWKANQPDLPTNEVGSIRRLEQLIRKLHRDGQMTSVEKSSTYHTRESKGVNRVNTESTKLRIVYDASARERRNQPSLNNCLNPGPPLQNHLWVILV